MWMTWVTPPPPADGLAVGVGLGFGREVALDSELLRRGVGLGRGDEVRRAVVGEAAGVRPGLAVSPTAGVGSTDGVAPGGAVAPALGLGLAVSDVLAPRAA
jgi:hypothetical protein